LAAKGYDVDLIDLADTPMTGASLHNEGKIHLGFVYASDPSKKTYKMMQQGALSFAHILKRLTGADTDSLILAKPFYYYVPVESMMSLDAIHEHFQNVEDKLFQQIRNDGCQYLNRSFDRLFERNSRSKHESLFSPDATLGSFRTEERSISPAAVANIVSRAVLSNPRISFSGNTLVVSVSRLSSGYVEVEKRYNKETSITRYPCVINCLWDGRLAIDLTAGVEDPGPWISRYKAAINVFAPYAHACNIPSSTGVVGLYGDVVNYGNGNYYISWYPKCKRVQSVDEDGRKLHDRFHRFIPRCIRGVVKWSRPAALYVSNVAHRKFAKENIRAMAKYIPSMEKLIRYRLKCEVGGGVIVAKGSTDIGDPSSRLHQRYEIGPVSFGAYISVYTGKFTTAPLIAEKTSNMVTKIL
jgi:hypothetical protein